MSSTGAAPGSCAHERGQIGDSRFHGDSYATPTSRQIFCDVWVQRWLDVEAALALRQGDLGIIPAEAAGDIAAAAQVERIDLEEVRDGIRRTGHSLVAILEGLQQACSPISGEFAHYGATTQDILAGFRGQGPELLAVFAERLSLGVPMIAWHVARDRVAEFVTALAMLVATAARVADEIRNLSRPELAELEEGWEFGKVGSSTMPHKRNPEQCERVVMLARLTKANAILGLECMIQEHERDSRGLRLEWVAVADASHHALAALSWLTRILVGLRVHADRMADNAQQAADKICTEALMLALGSSLGKQSAHALVYELSQTAHEHSRSLRQSLAARPDIVERLPAGDLDDAFDPRSYLGEATRTTEVVLAFADRWLAEQRP